MPVTVDPSPKDHRSRRFENRRLYRTPIPTHRNGRRPAISPFPAARHPHFVRPASVNSEWPRPSAPMSGKPVPLSPVESRCVPFCRRISIRPVAWLPAGPAAVAHAAAAHLKRLTLEIRLASQFFTCHPRDSLGKQQFGWTFRGLLKMSPRAATCPSCVPARPAHLSALAVRSAE
jgi:hypothetical protein